MLRHIVRITALSIGLSFFAGNAFAWEKFDEENGITAYRKNVPGSPIVAFKGDADVNASVERILWVLTNNKYKTEWVNRLKTSYELERKTPHHAVIYQVFKLPFPISNRDYVYEGKVIRKGEQILVDLKSTTHRKAPKTEGVRAHLKRCVYTLTPKGENKTHISVEVHTDPKGWLPTWLVNRIQKSWPIRTLSGVRKMVNHPRAKDFPAPPKPEQAAPAPAEPTPAEPAAAEPATPPAAPSATPTETPAATN